jgi:hypothetical protein
MTDDEGQARATAAARLGDVVSFLREEGVAARGIVGSDLPLEAIRDALAIFPATEILVIAPPRDRATWSDRDIAARALETYGRPLTEVVVPRAA